MDQIKYNWIATTIETAVEKGIMLDAKAISSVFNVTLKEANGVIDDYLKYVETEKMMDALVDMNKFEMIFVGDKK